MWSLAAGAGRQALGRGRRRRPTTTRRASALATPSPSPARSSRTTPPAATTLRTRCDCRLSRVLPMAYASAAQTAYAIFLQVVASLGSFSTESFLHCRGSQQSQRVWVFSAESCSSNNGMDWVPACSLGRLSAIAAASQTGLGLTGRNIMQPGLQWRDTPGLQRWQPSGHSRLAPKLRM